MRNPIRPRSAIAAALAALASHAAPAAASMFAGETLDKVADVLAIVVLIVVPIVAIVVFWLVHVLPERFAEKRHHPQTEAITTLCLLSLVFGGLLWPLAWLWAFTKPVAYKVAYGTEKHDAYFDEMHEKHLSGGLTESEADALRDELDAMAARGALPGRLQRLRERLDLREPTAGGAAASGGGA
jgi:CBS domain containing-hemolysin-like protein